jgi:hypothetical protein
VTDLCHGPVLVGLGNGQLVLSLGQLKNGFGKAEKEKKKTFRELETLKKSLSFYKC